MKKEYTNASIMIWFVPTTDIVRTSGLGDQNDVLADYEEVFGQGKT